MREAQQVPGLRLVTGVNNRPLEGIDTNGEYWISGRAPLEARSASAIFRVVGQEYFDLVNIPILKGRGFAEVDRLDSEPVAIVDHAMRLARSHTYL